MLLRRWTVPMRHVCRREKERRRRTKQSCPVVPSTAAYLERSMSLAGETPPENASSCDPDKRMMQRQENTIRIASAVSCAVSAHSEYSGPRGGPLGTAEATAMLGSSAGLC